MHYYAVAATLWWRAYTRANGILNMKKCCLLLPTTRTDEK